MAAAGGLPHHHPSHTIHPGLTRAPGGSTGSYEDHRDRDSYDDHHHRSMPKADAWREKNRLAQKAFRQRQKVRLQCAQISCIQKLQILHSPLISHALKLALFNVLTGMQIVRC